MEFGTDQAARSGELTLRDYVQLLLRRKKLIVAVFLAVLAAGLAWTLATPAVYESTASVLLRTQRNDQLFPPTSDSQRQSFLRDPGSEFDYVASTAFRSDAQRRVGGDASVTADYDSSAATSTTRSALFDFVARSKSPTTARDAAQVWAEHYIAERESVRSAEIGVAIDSLVQELAILEQERDRILGPLTVLDEALADQTDPVAVSQLSTQRLALQQALEDDALAVRFQIRALSEDLSKLQIASRLAEQPGISARLSKDAQLGVKVAPNVTRNLALAAVLGGLMAVGLAFLVDSLKTAISGRADVELVAGPNALLAEIPLLAAESDEEDLGQRLLYHAEVERVVSAVVHQATSFADGYRLLVTSPGAGDGKSTIAYEIGWRLGQGDIATVLVDADLRRPMLHNKLAVTNRRSGLSEYLARVPGARARAVRIEGNKPLLFIPAGAPTDDAASILRRGLSKVLDKAAGEENVVVIDSPPVMLVTDAEVIANCVDAVVVVVRAHKTSRTDLQLTLRRLAATRAALLGIVLVGAPPESSGGGYGYTYGYAVRENGEAVGTGKPSRGARRRVS